MLVENHPIYVGKPFDLCFGPKKNQTFLAWRLCYSN